MGAGIAKTIREKFPKVYDEYKQVCEIGLNPGDVFVYSENGKVIVNLATQYMPGPNATYEAVALSLMRLSRGASRPEKIAKYGRKIAIPEIGCGIGGLEWPVIEQIIKSAEAAYPEVEYEVWHYVAN
jgi:O-acetyl-ADP-ribose deacetylase (regulator of RNase III)